MYKRVLLILIILFSISFYNLSFMGSFARISELIGIGLILTIIIIYTIYDNSFRFKKSFSPFIILIFFSLPFSMYIADRYHGQSISLSLYAQRGIYYYLIYYALHKLKIKPEYLEKIFIYFGIIYIFLYMLQYFLYPRIVLFNAIISEDRETIRIGISGMAYLFILYFFSLQYALEHQRRKYIFILFLSLTIIIITGSRTLIFSILITTILNLLFSKKIKSKAIIYFISSIGVVLIYLIFQNIFIELINVTFDNSTNSIGKENIRLKAVKYFLIKFFPNTLSYIFGNGSTTAQSELTNTLKILSAKYGYFLSDLGIIGEYINYGLIFIFGVLGIIIKSLTSCIQNKYNYIKYFFIFTIFAMILGGGFDDPEFIILVCITIYMLDVSNHFKVNNELSSNINIKL